MSNPKRDDLTDQPMPSPTWKPDPKEMRVDPKPLPDQAQGSGSEDADEPPARSGMSERREKPTEAGGKDNPVHHTGRVPPKVTDEEL
ncbi:hypothetical protein AU381_18110 [Sinorhizobium glycinis]|uniref:Uncharacterized protein n=1 Tax=Sinorhizobium glycinis TaxID=1472378 RepID=A0A178XMH7_9HYPH|nr:hypothetical protein [Sinorhizobium glycinis]OAP36427.1 hypothetical protein AU381_18110 [Sinorhizobium glycinis]